MARLRPASAYRRLKRAYTRKSKYREKSYIKGVPGSKIIMFDQGAKTKKFPMRLTLFSQDNVNLRHNALESARIVVNRHLDRTVGKQTVALKIRAVPHHVMRENPLATGAGADRFSMGMKLSFGKAIGKAARLKQGAPIISIYCTESQLPHAKEALRKANSKFPMRTYLMIEKLDDNQRVTEKVAY